MRVPPLVLGLAALTAQRVLTKRVAAPSPARLVAAGASAAAAVAVLGAATREFRSRDTSVDPLRPERASVLVTGGPFAHTRNPMYVGMAGVLVAHAVLRGSPRALLPVLAFVVVIDRVQLPPEEAAMSALFGAEYDAYRTHVPRWVGPPRRVRRGRRPPGT